MGVILLEQTNEDRMNYCLFCQGSIKGWRHVHYITLEGFLESSDRKRRIAAAQKERKRPI